MLLMAQEWGKRCIPPMDDDDIARIVSDFKKKDEAKFDYVCTKLRKPHGLNWTMWLCTVWRGK